MAKKLKALAGSVTDNQLTSTIKESTQQILVGGSGCLCQSTGRGRQDF